MLVTVMNLLAPHFQSSTKNKMSTGSEWGTIVSWDSSTYTLTSHSFSHSVPVPFDIEYIAKLLAYRNT